MHLQEKIYEAIQRGLTKGLDFSFDDEDDLQSGPKKKLNVDKIAQSHKDWIWIQDNFVDLGLSSGTLWCNWNIGATCKDTPESWYGDYYMWGSTEPDTDNDCCWEEVFYNEGYYQFNKNYFNEHMYEFVDRNHELLHKYDTAYQTNSLMHMPTNDQLNELNAETNHEWVKNYNNITGLNGMLFKSRVNKNTLFIPAAGYRNQSDFNNVSSTCYLWSSSLYPTEPCNAYWLWVNSLLVNSDDPIISPLGGVHYYGFSVRGVINK